MEMTVTEKGDTMSKKVKWLGLGLIVVLAVVMVLAYGQFREKPVEGSKAITIEVVDDQKQSVVYELKTDALYLQQAMEEAKSRGLTFVGEMGPYGLMIEEINGVRAVFAESGAYWSFYVNGEYCNYGIGEQPVEDGDAFRIVYEK